MHPSLSWNVGTASGRTVNQKRDARFCPANRLGDYKREQNYWLIIVALSSWQNRIRRHGLTGASPDGKIKSGLLFRG
jgi:hypothetical protein